MAPHLQSNSYLLDGASLINTYAVSAASGTGNTLGVDGIREYKVVTNNFSAEYGMTMGSQTVLVSKSGTNSFHGDGFEFLRNSVLDAANYFDAPQLGERSRTVQPAVFRNFDATTLEERWEVPSRRTRRSSSRLTRGFEKTSGRRS